ncbi:hypothetical protein [Methanobrevibacter sp.]
MLIANLTPVTVYVEGTPEQNANITFIELEPGGAEIFEDVATHYIHNSKYGSCVIKKNNCSGIIIDNYGRLNAKLCSERRSGHDFIIIKMTD